MMIQLRRVSIRLVLLTTLMSALVGCDLVDDDEDFSPLLGSWVTQDLSLDGTSVKAQLDAEYERLVLTLREGADNGEFFTIIGREEGAQEDLVVQGTFDADDTELTLFPDNGPTVEFDYVVSDSLNPSLQLTAEEGRSEDLFLELIRLSIRGDVDRLDVQLSKDGRRTNAAPTSLGRTRDIQTGERLSSAEQTR